MTIIFNFCYLAAFMFCLRAWFRLRRSYQRIRNEVLKAYSNGFFFVSFAYLILSLPGLVLFDCFWIQIDFILVDICFLIAILFSGPAFFSSFFEKFRHLKKRIFFLILSYILIYILLNLIFFSSAIPLTEDNIVYFWKAGTPWLQTIARGFLVAALLLMAVFFFRWAKESPEKIVSYRSFFIGLGTLIIAAAGFVLWFFPFFYFSSNLLIFSGLFGFSGFMIGVVNTTVLKFPEEISGSGV